MKRVSYVIMRGFPGDSLGIVNDARVELKRKGDSLSGPLLGKTLKRVSYIIMRGFPENLVQPYLLYKDQAHVKGENHDSFIVSQTTIQLIFL